VTTVLIADDQALVREGFKLILELAGLTVVDLERLVTHYVEKPPSGLTQPDFVEDLSARELEVVRLVGRGLSNQEIADALVFSLATVKTHVRHLLQKLNLRDRVHAVVLAHEHGLV
jgi:DNA-binding NarL/FixJ family response regulator